MSCDGVFHGGVFVGPGRRVVLLNVPRGACSPFFRRDGGVFLLGVAPKCRMGFGSEEFWHGGVFCWGSHRSAVWGSVQKHSGIGEGGDHGEDY